MTETLVEDRRLSVVPDEEALLAEMEAEGEVAITPTLSRVVDLFQGWLHLPDVRPLYNVLGTIAANNYVEGDPVWTILVGPPGSGKTEMLQSVAELEGVFSVGTLTGVAAFLSGTSLKERAKDAKGGLLNEIGERGHLLCKDFGSVLSMHRDARAEILAALREIYDGSWSRPVGSDGGKTLRWKGKLGFLGGATQSIDRHHSVMAALGERFTFARMPRVDAEKQAHRALTLAGSETQMRRELSEAVIDLFGRGIRKEPRKLSEKERDDLISLAILAVTSRSAVERSGYNRDVETVPHSEAPARLVKVLDRLFAGLDVIGLDRETAWDVVRQTALDSVPDIRRKMMERLAHESDFRDIKHLSQDLPTSTARRALEDLTLHGIATVDKTTSNAYKYRFAPDARTRYERAMGAIPKNPEPETSGRDDAVELAQAAFDAEVIEVRTNG